MSQPSPSSPTGAALVSASELAARPVPAPAVPDQSSSGTEVGDAKTVDAGIPIAAGAAASTAARPGVGPRQNSKVELMESAHLLCSLFGGGSPAKSTSAPVESAPAAAAEASVEAEAVPPPTALVRHGSKGPLKKRMMMPGAFDDDEKEPAKAAQAKAGEEDPAGLKTAVVAAVAMQRQQQQQQLNKQQQQPTNTNTNTAANNTIPAPLTGTTGTPTGDYCTVLYTPGEDEIYLSPQLCLTRAQIEAFEAQPADVSSRRSAGGRSISRTLTVGQVGLRCVHCKHLTLRDRSMSAVHYPGSIRLVYQAVRNFQRNHFLQCKAMPQSIKDEFQTTRSRFVQSKGRSHVYWAKSCAEKGMVDTPDGGIRFNVDASGEVVPANPDSAVLATEAFMAQNASRGPAARKRKAERDANGSGSDGDSDAAGTSGKDTKTRKPNNNKKKKARASKKTVAVAAAAAVAARNNATGTTTDDAGITANTTQGTSNVEPAIETVTKEAEEKAVEDNSNNNALEALAQPQALAAVAAVAPGPAPTVPLGASSNVEGGVMVAPPAPALTAQVSLDAEQILRRHLQEYQQFPQQQGLLDPSQQQQGGQDSALAQADLMIRASLLEQEQQRQLLAAHISGQYQQQQLQQALAQNNPAASPTLAASSAPAGAGAAAPSAASLLLQQQQKEMAASLGLGLPESAAAVANAAMQQQAAAASSSPGAAANAATRAEYLVYLETLDRMSASINAAQNLEAAYRTNPTVVGRLQYLAANDEMAAVMHQAKIQAMNLQRIRLESRLSDLNASLSAAPQGGASAAGAAVVPDAAAQPLSPNSLLRQVSE